MTTTSTTALDPQRVQRRTVFLLSSAQLLSGVGNGATLSIGSLLAVDLSGSEAWAGSITTVLTLAAAIAALPLARLAEARGRRVGLVTGLVAAMIGALLIIASVTAQSFALALAGRSVPRPGYCGKPAGALRRRRPRRTGAPRTIIVHGGLGHHHRSCGRTQPDSARSRSRCGTGPATHRRSVRVLRSRSITGSRTVVCRFAAGSAAAVPPAGPSG